MGGWRGSKHSRAASDLLLPGAHSEVLAVMGMRCCFCDVHEGCLVGWCADL